MNIFKTSYLKLEVLFFLSNYNNPLIHNGFYVFKTYLLINFDTFCLRATLLSFNFYKT